MLTAMASLEGGGYEMLFYKKNGHAIWLQVDVTPIKNDQVNFICFLGEGKGRRKKVIFFF